MAEVVSRVIGGCAGCRRCVRICPPKAFSLRPVGLVDYIVEIDLSKCNGASCLRCEAVCRAGLLDVMSMIQDG
jgi:ferredoxin